jgi:hypothetical protein
VHFLRASDIRCPLFSPADFATSAALGAAQN